MSPETTHKPMGLLPSALARGTNCAVWAPHRHLGFVYIYVAIVRSRSGMQLQLDRSTKHVIDDTDGDDEERPAQRVEFTVETAIHVRLFFIGDTEVSTPWILALGDVQETAETPSYSHSLSLTTSTSQQCTTKRSHLLQPLHAHACS